MKFSRQKKKSGPTADDNEGVGKESLKKKTSEDGMNTVYAAVPQTRLPILLFTPTLKRKKKDLVHTTGKSFFFLTFDKEGGRENFR